MKPSYDELFEAYLNCEQERYKLLDKKHELEAKLIISEQEIDRLNNRIHALEKHNAKLQQEAQKYFDLLVECEHGDKKGE